VFGSAKHGANFLPSVDDESHKPNCINFSCPRVVILAYQPRSVDNLSILGLPCVAQSMFLICPQGGIVVSEIMCRNPTLAKCGGEAQHFQSWGLGVLRDSRMFGVRQRGPKHLALRCSWCHWKGLKA
jgi:hypothetical protein